MKNEKRYSDGIKALFVVVGAVVTIGAVLFTLYTIFKKYFKITFDCDGNCADCDGCDEECFEEECESYEPICCCQDDEEDEDAAEETI